MGSAYTDNNKFEKIGTGEQAGTWGTTTNLNFDMIDRAINGVTSIGLTGTSSSITTSDGALTDGLFKVLQFTGSLSAGHTVTIAPNSVKKLYFVKNASGDTVTFIQGTGGTVGNGRAVAIENNKTGIIFCDGTGDNSTAKVTKIETGSDEFTTDVTIKTDDGALLTLQTSDTTITDGDVLGALQFRAPSEGSGTDAIAVAGAIVAEADATFTDEIASTDLVFKVGTAVASDNAAVEKMRLTHEGDLEVKAADGAILKLQTTSTDVTDGNVLGAVEFNAPLEAGGTDAITTAASIVAEADDTFAADNNETDLVFKLGVSEAATEKMRLTHEGDLNLVTDNKSINFGADSEITLTHVADTGLTLTHTATGAGTPVVLNLKSEEDAIADGDVIGKITFTAGDSDGTDAIATAASIEAEADNTFAADNNQTDLVFKLGSSEAATEKMRLTHEGALVVTGDVTAFSDERLKSDVKTIDNALDKVMNMRGVSYTKQAEKGVGVVAQEIEKVLPEVVTDGEYKSVAYGNIVGVLIEAIKEQQKQIDELKKDK